VKLAARPFSEHALQIAVCQYMDIALRPGLYYLAIPNGGMRDISTARKLKAEGVRAGVADLQIMMEEGRSAWIELKIKGGSLSPVQKDFRDVCRALGHPWTMAKTIDEAKEFLTAIGAVRGNVTC
jgi:hypothetical protein